MDINADAIAQLVMVQFDTLPTKAKPLVRGLDNKGVNVREWVPMSGIVAQSLYSQSLNWNKS